MNYLDARLSKGFVDYINACEDLATLRWEAKNGQACARDLADFSDELLAALRPFAEGVATAENFAKAAELVKRSDDFRKLGETRE